MIFFSFIFYSDDSRIIAMKNFSLSDTVILWNKVLERAEHDVSKQIFDAFFRTTSIAYFQGDSVFIMCDGKLTKTVLEDSYKNYISNIISAEVGDTLKLEFLTKDQASTEGGVSFGSDNFQDETEEYFQNVVLDPSFTFDNFIVGKSNNEAQKASLIVASNPGTMFQTLFLYGGSGLGKTHLLNAIGNYIKSHFPEKKVLYCSSQDFLNEYLNFVNGSARTEQLNSYLKKFDVFLIDDIQMLKDKKKTQEFFFNIYEDFRQNHKQFCITSDKLPSELDGIDTRIITRFTSGLAVPIYKPDTDTCIQILKSKIANGDYEIKNYDEDVIYFLAEKFKDSIRSLEGALIRLNFYASINHVDKIDIGICTEALQGMIDVSDAKSKVTVQKILNTVSNYYSLSVTQITGKNKSDNIANARHVAIYLIRDMLDLPFKKIGEIFSNRDHSTIMHSIEKVDNMLKTNEQLRVVITELKKRLGS